ncbi:hypothetical protein PLICRDRAFT_107715 [Plicaturopsis crispa FD-325 SS-3]|nr:hypothetical protein PLICRDRAFT_107715 [Plicaturopsis crispa FD-325 SS-3]
MATLPPDITVSTLSKATGQQLHHWESRANQEAGTKVLKHTGKVADRRQRLAGYYALDLSETPRTQTEVGPVPLDLDIRRRQWDHLRTVGADWGKALERGETYLFSDCSPGMSCPRIYQSMNAKTSTGLSFRTGVLPSETAVPSQSALDLTTASYDTIDATLAAARQGDPLPIDSNDNLIPAVLSMHGPSVAATPSTSRLPPIVTSNPVSSSASGLAQAELLKACEIDMEVLNRASCLQDVLEQVDRGDVARIREKYGPKTENRNATSMWPRIKQTVTRRERIAHELQEHFHGDKEKFLAFFTLSSDDSSSVGRKRKGKGKEGAVTTQPYQLVVEAIPKRKKDLASEREQQMYWASGEFSSDLWRARWGNMNDWEVWRELGLERY